MTANGSAVEVGSSSKWSWKAIVTAGSSNDAAGPAVQPRLENPSASAVADGGDSRSPVADESGPVTGGLLATERGDGGAVVEFSPSRSASAPTPPAGANRSSPNTADRTPSPGAVRSSSNSKRGRA